MNTRTYRVRSGEDLGRVLRDTRFELDLTQQQLVDELGLPFDRTRLARIEAGEGFQSLDRVLSVLRRLGVEVTATVPETMAERFPALAADAERRHAGQDPHRHAADDRVRDVADDVDGDVGDRVARRGEHDDVTSSDGSPESGQDTSWQ